MTLVSSVDVIDGGTLCFFGIVCGHFFCWAWAACLGRLFGGDIRLGSLGLGKGPRAKLERLESFYVDSGQLVEILTRVSLPRFIQRHGGRTCSGWVSPNRLSR